MSKKKFFKPNLSETKEVVEEINVDVVETVEEEPTEVVEESTTETVEPTKEDTGLNHSAFSIVKHDGKFKVVEIKFDPVTGEVGEVELTGGDLERLVAIENFKIAVVKAGILG